MWDAGVTVVPGSTSLALTCTARACLLKSSYNPPLTQPHTRFLEHSGQTRRSAHRRQVLSWRYGTSGGVTPTGIKRNRQPTDLREVTARPRSLTFKPEFTQMCTQRTKMNLLELYPLFISSVNLDLSYRIELLLR